MKKLIVIGFVLVSLVSCTAIPLVGTVMNPLVDVGDKTCAVLSWGIPIAKDRIGTLTPNQITLVADVERVARMACLENNVSWKQRAGIAAVVLSDILWDKIR